MVPQRRVSTELARKNITNAFLALRVAPAKYLIGASCKWPRRCADKIGNEVRRMRGKAGMLIVVVG